MSDEENDPVREAARPQVERLVGMARQAVRASDSLVVTEYLILAHATGFDADGQRISAVVLIPDGPSHQMLGLLAEATVRFQADVMDQYSGD